MKLSKQRRNLLKQNKSKIAAYSDKNKGKKEGICFYQYNNGEICVASACLTEQERAGASVERFNGKTIDELVEFNVVIFSEDDVIILKKLQDLHDKIMFGENKFVEFDNLVNQMIEGKEYVPSLTD